MGWVEEGKRRAGTRQGLGFSIGQADLASGWAFDQLWHIWLPPGPSHCNGGGISKGVLGQQPFVELHLGQREPNAPWSSGQHVEPCPSLCSSLIPLFWICVLQPCDWHLAGLLMPWRNICINVEVCIYVSVTVQPCQNHFISSVKISVEKKIRGFWSPMRHCVSLWVREEVGKTVSLQSCSPDPAISMSDMVCAVWLVIVTRFALPFGKGRNKSRQCFTEDSIWLWKICATWLILCKGHQNYNCVPHERW